MQWHFCKDGRNGHRLVSNFCPGSAKRQRKLPSRSKLIWNKGKLIGQKPPLKPKEIWAIRVRLQLLMKVRELAIFNLAIDSKLRGCDRVKLRVQDVTHGNQVAPRTMVMQQKTQRPVQFELTEPTREAFAAWIAKGNLKPEQFLFPSLKRPVIATHLARGARPVSGRDCVVRSQRVSHVSERI